VPTCAKNRADGRRSCERRAGEALARHLVAVMQVTNAEGLAGQVHQDGGGRAAVLGAVIDPASMSSGRGATQEVIGSGSRSCRGGPMPGSTPISVPTVTPIRHSEVLQESATPKPKIGC